MYKKIASGYVENAQKFSQSVPKGVNVTVCLYYNPETNHMRAISHDVDVWENEEFPIDACTFPVTLVNLTPHEIKLGEYEVFTIPASGIVARCAQKQALHHYIGGFKVYKVKFGDVESLPPQVDGIHYIVSRVVLDSLNGSRPDVVGVGEAIRNAKGEVIGAKNLSI